MRILFTSHYALPHQGGIEVVVDQLARALTRRGHQITHLASNIDQRTAFDRPYRFVPVAASNLLESRAGVPMPLFSPRLLLSAHVQVRQADVVHAHGYLYPSSALAMVGTRLRLPKGPVRVLTEHVGNVPYRSRALNAIERIAIATLGRAVARSAEAIVVFNGRVEEELRGLAPSGDLRWIPNGVDRATFHPPAAGEKAQLRRDLGWDDRPRVLFVGRLVEKKGLRLLLDIAREGAAAFEVVAAGPGAAPVTHPPNVAFLGTHSPGRLAELYRAADAFCLPSQGEGFPLTVQEALASGLPAFVLQDRGYDRYAGLEGLHRMAPDAANIAATIVEALRTGPASRAPRLPSWDEVAEQHERLYETLLARRRRA